MGTVKQWQALLYIVAVMLLILAAFGASARVRLDIVGFALAILAFALPVIVGA